jgi:hypothetical protein
VIKQPRPFGMPRWISLGVSLYFISYYGRKAIVAETKING